MTAGAVTDDLGSPGAPLVTVTVDMLDAVDVDLASATLRDGLRHEAAFCLDAALPPGVLVLPDLSLVRSSTGERERSVLAELPGRAVVSVKAIHGRVEVVVRGADRAVVADLWQRLRARAAEHLDRTARLPLQLWSSSYDPVPRSHDIAPVPWADVRRNYSVAAALALDPLMTLSRPGADRGRLVLWHGPPGTGKTSAVASLATQWLPWCETHVVTDPEAFFTNPDYLLTVEENPGRVGPRDRMPDLDEPWPRPWKLVVCEDADEYLRSDARSRSGPALGRLLNLTDGLMGRERHTVVLLTTNDDAGRLHPAVTRPGRCLSRVEIGPLSVTEADAWLPDGVRRPTGATTLAELYAALGGRDVPVDGHVTGLYL